VGEWAVPFERLDGVEQLDVAQRTLETVKRDREAILELVDSSQQQLGAVPAWFEPSTAHSHQGRRAKIAWLSDAVYAIEAI
jgi:hypothetical protein